MYLLEAHNPYRKRTANGSDALKRASFLAYIRDKAAFIHTETAERGGFSQAGFCIDFDFSIWLALDLQYPRLRPGELLSSHTERATTMRLRNETTRPCRQPDGESGAT